MFLIILLSIFLMLWMFLKLFIGAAFIALGFFICIEIVFSTLDFICDRLLAKYY